MEDSKFWMQCCGEIVEAMVESQTDFTSPQKNNLHMLLFWCSNILLERTNLAHYSDSGMKYNQSGNEIYVLKNALNKITQAKWPNWSLEQKILCFCEVR